MKDRSKKTRIVSNAKRVNPTKFDPTRTTTLRRAFVGKLRRKFARLRKAIYDLLVVEDALGLKKNLTYNHIEKLPSGKYRLLSHTGKNLGTFDSHEEAAKHEGEVEYFKHAANSFCPTGPGGGVDPSCSPSDGVSSISSKQEHVMKIDSLSKDREHAMSFDAKTGELLREESGNTGADWSKGENYSVSIPRDLMASKVISHLHTHMDEYSSFSDGDWAVFASKQIKDMTVVDKFNVYTLVKPESYISAERSKYTPRELKEAWEKELYKIESADVKGTKSPGQLIDETNKNLASIYGFQYTSRPKYPTTNERWRFNTTPEQLEAFKEWLKTQVEYYVTGMTDEELWRKFIESGFKKGAGRAFDDTKPQAGWTEAEGAFYAGTKDQFLKSAFGQPESVEKVQLLAARTFEELKGMSEDMQTKVGRILVDGLTRGDGPLSIAREMSNQLNLSMTRAETIARTELIRAHAEGQLVGLEELGVDEVGVMVEWSTAGDDRVCELCEPMEGVVLKIEEARGMIPRHPNCRCAFIPANVAEPTDDQKRGKRKIMSAVRTSAALGKDDFSTAVPVTKERPKSILPVITNHWWLVPSVVYQFSSLLVNTFCHTGPGGGVDPTCSPGGVPSDSSLPSLTTLSKVKDLPGSTHPVLMKDAEGKHFVVKEGKSPDHLKNENAADAIYRAAGVKVPKSAIIDGKKVSEFTNGTTTLGQYVNSGHSAIDMYKQIGQHFVMDALMANHDVIGLSADNILIKDGQAIRVDNGGAMKYRAQGGIKPSKLWGPEVVQLESMRDKNINPQSAKVFAHLTDHDIKEQIKDVVSKRETIINAAKSAGVDHEVLSKRLDYLEAKLKLPAPTMVKPATIDHSLSSPHDQVKPTAIINGQHLANMLKSKFAGHAYTPLYLKKIEALNPNGVHGGTVIIPMTSIKFTDKNSVKIAKDKQAEVVAAIKQMAPAGTIIKAKATMSAKAAGVTKTFGSGSKYEGTFTTEKAKVGAKLISESDPQYAGKFTPVVDGVAKHSPMKIYDEKAHDEWVNLITSAEKSAVASWKGSAKSIRASVSSGVLSPTAKNFMSALEKAKPHEGPLYRGISGEYADGIAKQIQEAGIGGTWSDPAPHCTSVKQSIGINFSGGKLLFRIQSLTARPIHKEDGHFTEHEVVGMPNAKYRIVGIHSNVKIMQQNSEYGNTIKHVIDLVEEHK